MNEIDDNESLKCLSSESMPDNEIIQCILNELSEFDYAFIDDNGKELDYEEAMKAVVQSPDQLAYLGKGVCTDFVEYTSKKLSEHNIDHSVYFIKCVDKDGDEPSHVFVVVDNKDKVLWLEAAWYSEAGIHQYDSLKELFEDVAKKHCIYGGENYLDSCEIKEIKKSLVGMSQKDVYDYVDTLPIIWKATQEVKAGSLIENLIITKKDILLNLEQFESNKINILLITGFSGSGKSTLASELARKYSAINYELDCLDLWNSEMLTADDLVGKEDGLLAFIKANNIKPNKNASNNEINTLYKRYIEFLIPWCVQHSQQKFIIEGLQLYTVYDKLSIDLTKYPVIIKGTSGIMSAFRASKRNAKANNTSFIDELKLLLPWLRQDNRLLNQLARGLTISEGVQKITYTSVSDIGLFKEYAYDILGGYGNMSEADIKSFIKEIHFEGKLAGYIGFSEYEENGHKCLGIGNFMIIERGKGLGSAVIQNIVEKYKNQYDIIYCFVDAKNEGAIRLYKKLGKVYDEECPNDNGEYYVTFWDNGKWKLDENLNIFS